MRFSAFTLVAAVPTLVSAANITINVGANGLLAFDPPSVNASIGDMVNFVFQAKNHTVTQSTFTDPCTRSNVNGTEGFSSPFEPVTAGSTAFPNFAINITQTAPIWFFCEQTTPVNHCQSGMVGAINPTPDKTLDQFKATAMGSNSTSNSSTTASGTASGTAASATALPLPGTPLSSSTLSTSSSTSTIVVTAGGAGSSTAAVPTTTKSSGAIRMNGGTAGLLAFFGIAAGMVL